MTQSDFKLKNQTHLIRRKQIKERMGGISDMTLWRREQEPDFPPRIKIGGTVFFEEQAFERYIAGKVQIMTPEAS